MYLVDVYDGMGGSGYQIPADSAEDAVKKAKAEWDHLDPRDQANYRSRPENSFAAIKCDSYVEDGEELPDMGNYDVLWDALKDGE